jgi:chromosome segregation ATPase
MLDNLHYQQLQDDALMKWLENEKGYRFEDHEKEEMEKWRQLFLGTFHRSQDRKQQRERYKQQNIQLRERIRYLEEENNRLQHEVLDYFSKSKDEKINEIGSLKGKVINLEREIRQLKIDKESLTENNQNLTETNEELQNELRLKQVEVENLTEQNENLTDKNLQLEDEKLELENKLLEKDKEFKGLEEINELLNSSIEDLEAINQELSKQNQDLQEELEQTEQEKFQLQTNYDNLVTNFNELNTLLENLTNEFNQIITEQEELAKRFKKLKAENKVNLKLKNAYRKKVDNSLRELKELEATLLDVQQELEEEKEHLKEAHKEIEKQRKRVERITRRNQNLRKREKEADQNYKELDDQYKKLAKQKSRVDIRLVRQINNLKRLEKSKKDLRSELNAKEEKIERLERRLEVRTNQRDRARKKLKALKDKQQEIKTEAENKKVCLTLIKYENITDKFFDENDHTLVKAVEETSNSLIDVVARTQNYLGVTKLCEIEKSHKMPVGKSLADLIGFYNNPPTTNNEKPNHFLPAIETQPLPPTDNKPNEPIIKEVIKDNVIEVESEEQKEMIRKLKNEIEKLKKGLNNKQVKIIHNKQDNSTERIVIYSLLIFFISLSLSLSLCILQQKKKKK